MSSIEVSINVSNLDDLISKLKELEQVVDGLAEKTLITRELLEHVKELEALTQGEN